jgi:predicted AAA+ superfamily ATPase
VLTAYHYFNLEDERLLSFGHQDFNALLEVFYEIDPDCKLLLFDEIQNVYGWEKFVRRLFNEGYKIFVTGSNAKLLSSEISTSLTGRNLMLELYPFSFEECLQYSAFPKKSVYTTRERSMITKLMESYLKFGGFPEIVKSQDREELGNWGQGLRGCCPNKCCTYTTFMI